MITRRALGGAAAATSGVLSGCAVFTLPPQTAALAQALPAGLPRRAELAEVPFFPQTPYHCGPAALATVLGHIGLPTDPKTLGEAVFLPAREGSLQVEMLAGARRHGAVATRLPGELSALLQEVAAGHAVVVLQNLGLSFAPRWHYAVLVGYDLGRGEVVLRSGVTERESMPFRTFEHTWARSGHWALAVLPPEHLPVTTDERAATEAAIGYERAAPPLRAAQAYRTLLQRWPGSLTAAMGLGNTLHTAGDLPAAAQAFQNAAEQHNSAPAWNNLARMQLALGDAPKARESAERAVRRAEVAEPQWLPAVRATLSVARAAVEAR